MMSGLTRIRLPGSLRYLGTCTFYGCMKLKTVKLPEGLERISNDCFSSSRVEELWVPRSLTEFAHNMYDPHPMTVFFPDGLQEIQKTEWFLYGHVGHAVVPASVQTIADGAFQDCVSLHAIEFAPGSALQTIGASAFQNSGLQKFVAPLRLQKIGARAFFGCA